MDLSCLIGSILSLTCVLEKEHRFKGQPGALDINIFFFPFRLMYAFWCLFYCVESQSLFFCLVHRPRPIRPAYSVPKNKAAKEAEREERGKEEKETKF